MASTHSVSLPQIVEAQDYHDFAAIEQALNLIFKEKIKVEEIGFNPETGQYEGIVFAGRSAEAIKRKRALELHELWEAS